jgi:hypothetical protein
MKSRKGRVDSCFLRWLAGNSACRSEPTSGDSRHKKKYPKSQTSARVAKENRAHNGSKRREAKV